MAVNEKTDTLTISPEAAAIVAGPSHTIADLQFFMPHYEDDADIPGPIVFLAAVYARMKNDTAFAEETMRWFQGTETVH